MASGLDAFHDFVFAAASETGEFRAEPYFDSDADCLVFFARDEPSYAKRVNSLLTVYLSEGDNSPVGCKVKGIRHIVGRMKAMQTNWGCHWFDERLKLGIIIELALFEPAENPESEFAVSGLGDRFRDVEFDRDLVTLS